jgi:hypothetical protein
MLLPTVNVLHTLRFGISVCFQNTLNKIYTCNICVILCYTFANSKKLQVLRYVLTVCFSDKRNKIYTHYFRVCKFIHSFSSLSHDRALHVVRAKASSFRWEYPLLSLRSSSSFLRLLPRLPVTSIRFLSFLQQPFFRRRFLRKMWPIQLAFRLLISYTYTCTYMSCIYKRHPRCVLNTHIKMKKNTKSWSKHNFIYK